eukprot:TRINITY_DN2704_c0_g4_i1.p1 TRINITY_DN2704_c0_g4~~TRINITY_DN2704_c0_g4_i1.p1  ORF type:complete len:330 (+),score=49.72 TRINITY_DN2704_c0_g4_i1:45-1034(+)
MAGVLSLLGIVKDATVFINFEDEENKETITIPEDNTWASGVLPVFSGDEPIQGEVHCKIRPKRLEHTGITIEFIGEVDLIYDRGHHHEFTNQVLSISEPGVISGEHDFKFYFDNDDKQYDSYYGLNARLRYYIKFTITRTFAPDIIGIQELWIRNYSEVPDLNPPIKMEVGIEDCLHIEFEYFRSRYNLRDIVVGKVFFLLTRIQIRFMEVSLVRKESTGSGHNIYNETETLTKYEIMEGAPVKGEIVPIRLPLSAFDLTPTYKEVHNRFSVRYFLNLVLVDEEERRYFKQSEIDLFRLSPNGMNYINETKNGKKVRTNRRRIRRLKKT